MEEHLFFLKNYFLFTVAPVIPVFAFLFCSSVPRSSNTTIICVYSVHCRIEAVQEKRGGLAKVADRSKERMRD
jgi:hypothetical protein